MRLLVARGQVGLEYMAIITLALVLLVPAALFVYQDALIQNSVLHAQLAASKIAAAADAVKVQSPGSKTTVEVYFPKGISAVTIGGKEVLFRMTVSEGKSGDVYRVTAANLTAAELPNSEGVYSFEIIHLASGNVSIRSAPQTPAPVSIDEMISYFDSIDPNTPKYRTYKGGWSAEASALGVGANNKPKHMLRAAPTRNEIILVTQDSDHDIKAQVWNGTAWANSVILSAGGAKGDQYRSFSIAYEQTNGRALVVYRKSSALTTPYYRIWNGISWSAEAAAPDFGAGGDIAWLHLTAKTGSNEIMLAGLKDNNDLFAVVWDGSAWGSVTTIETEALCDYQCFDVAYERNSGEALIAYRESSGTTPRYRTYSGGSWSGEASANDVGGAPQWLRLSTNPVATSNSIVMAVLDDQRDLNVQVWNGASWGATVELDADLETSSKRAFDVAFQSNGTAIIVYGEASDSLPTYRVLGSSWTAASKAVNVGGSPVWIVLAANTVANDLIMLASEDDNNDLSVQRWTGSAWGDYAEVEDQSDSTYEGFSAVYPRD